MVKLTKTELLHAGFKACGWKVDPKAKTSKYTVYVKTGQDAKYLIGKSGALRKTRTNVADSISLSHKVNLLEAYRKVGSRAASYSSVEQAVLDLQAIYAESYKTKIS